MADSGTRRAVRKWALLGSIPGLLWLAHWVFVWFYYPDDQDFGHAFTLLFIGLGVWGALLGAATGGSVAYVVRVGVRNAKLFVWGWGLGAIGFVLSVVIAATTGFHVGDTDIAVVATVIFWGFNWVIGAGLVLHCFVWVFRRL